MKRPDPDMSKRRASLAAALEEYKRIVALAAKMPFMGSEYNFTEELKVRTYPCIYVCVHEDNLECVTRSWDIAWLVRK
jgi:hypothetical protein